jgi:hypothetical protein
MTERDEKLEAEIKEITESGNIELAEPIREREEDLLKRQIILIQYSKTMEEFVARTDVFEAMMEEDIRKQRVAYDPLKIEQDIRDRYNISVMTSLNKDMQHKVSLEKFRKLYFVFKHHHLPVTMETRL